MNESAIHTHGRVFGVRFHVSSGFLRVRLLDHTLGGSQTLKKFLDCFPQRGLTGGTRERWGMGESALVIILH